MAASLASVDDAPWTEFHSLGTDAMQLTARARLIPQLASKSFFFFVCAAHLISAPLGGSFTAAFVPRS